MAELEERYGAYHDDKGRLQPEVWDGGAGGGGGWKAVARDRHLAWRRVTDVLGRVRGSPAADAREFAKQCVCLS